MLPGAQPEQPKLPSQSPSLARRSRRRMLLRAQADLADENPRRSHVPALCCWRACYWARSRRRAERFRHRLRMRRGNFWIRPTKLTLATIGEPRSYTLKTNGWTTDDGAILGKGVRVCDVVSIVVRPANGYPTSWHLKRDSCFTAKYASSTKTRLRQWSGSRGHGICKTLKILDGDERLLCPGCPSVLHCRNFVGYPHTGFNISTGIYSFKGSEAASFHKTSC